uniref:F-box domain-containing protein n=1 Tax=Parastrongyloides trichosuri TaxID=131310 RepID=A0A0N4Z6C5_PARTI
MNLLQLPTEILIKILSYIEYHEIKNAFNANGLLCSLISKNRYKLNKPYINNINIKSINNYNHEERFKINIKYRFKNIDEENIYKTVKNNNVNLIEIKEFLQRFEFTKIDSIILKLNNSKGFFDMFNNFIKNTKKINTVFLKIEKSSLYDGLVQFLSYLNELTFVYMDGICFYPQPHNVSNILPILKSLNNFWINESSQMGYFNSKMMEKILLKKPNICIVGDNYESFNFDMDLINIAIDKQKSCNKRSHYYYYDIGVTGDFNVWSLLNNELNDTEYEWTSRYNVFSYNLPTLYGLKKCDCCGNDNIIEIVFHIKKGSNNCCKNDDRVRSILR